MKISDFIKLSESSVSSELWTAEMSCKIERWGWYTRGTTECTFNLKTQKVSEIMCYKTVVSPASWLDVKWRQ